MSDDLHLLLHELGLPPLGEGLLEDDPPVAVDRERLRKFFGHKLGRSEQHHIALLVTNYRQWYKAGMDVLREMTSSEVKTEGQSLESEREWLTLKGDLDASPEDVVAFALAFTIVLRQRLRILPISGRTKGDTSTTKHSSPDDQDVFEQFRRGRPIIAADSDHWIHTIVKGDSLFIRAGRNSGERFDKFVIEFRKGNVLILRVEAGSGVVTLGVREFRQLSEIADSIAILHYD